MFVSKAHLFLRLQPPLCTHVHLHSLNPEASPYLTGDESEAKTNLPKMVEELRMGLPVTTLYYFSEKIS